ncbi:MAG: hypothetical protein HY248_01965, partial [Fimbriimonas ginsengisoli]|nr:hypothetical protein [Fimbriimonas ginsengisoli]
DAYYGGAPKLRRIEHLVVKDPATRLGKFRAGEVEIAGVEQQNVPGLRRDSALKDALHLYDRPAVAYIAFGRFGYAPFADRRVRRAMAMGIDRRKIVEVLLGGVNPSANGILPPGVLGHRDATAFLPYDPAGAGAELAAAGYPGGRGLPPLEIVYREQTPDSRIIAEAAATQLQANLGIVARPRSMEWRSFLETRNHNKLGAYILAWYADYLDPENFLSNLMTTKSNGNHFGYSNLEVDRLCAQADTSLDQALRTKLYARAEDLILQDAVWLPLYFRREPELVSARVTGLRDNLFGHLPNTTVELK